MEEKFVLNELDQRQGLWGWKWEAGLSSSSLQFQASLLLFPHSSCWASHLSLLSEPLSLPWLHLCVHLPYTYSHTLSEPLTIAAVSLFSSFDFFFQPHIVNKCKKLWSKWCRKVFSYNKEKQKNAPFTHVRQNSCQDLKYQPGKTVNEVEIVDSINCANSGSPPTKI